MEVVSLSQKRTRRKRILLVDDVELFLQLQVSYLGHRRFEIHTARSGTQALEMAREVKPDLILLDMFMPDITGDVVCRKLKSDPVTSSIPVVIVSSGGRGDSRKRVETAGCDGLIYKPVRKDLLVSVVEKCLNVHVRRQPRVRVGLPVTVKLEGEDQGFPSFIRSLSADGVFVEMKKETTIVGDLMQLSFRLPGVENCVEVRSAAVVWLGNLGQCGPFGAGIRFLSVFPDTVEDISRFVDSILEREGTGNGKSAVQEKGGK
jgi:CheY-like chemotaxis protein